MDSDSSAHSAPGPVTEKYLRTEFLEQLSHEIRNPSGVVLGALDELELQLADEAAQRAEPLLRMARRSLRRMLRTAERLWRTAIVERRDLELTPTLADLRGLVRHAAVQAEQLESRRGIRLGLDMSQRPCVAAVDAEWFTLAIGELVAGCLRHARRWAHAHVGEHDNAIVVRLCTDATLLEVPRQGRFEPGQRVPAAELAWPLARYVVEAHGGRFEIAVTEPCDENLEPAGTRIVLAFPQVSSQTAPRP